MEDWYRLYFCLAKVPDSVDAWTRVSDDQHKIAQKMLSDLTADCYIDFADRRVMPEKQIVDGVMHVRWEFGSCRTFFYNSNNTSLWEIAKRLRKENLLYLGHNSKIETLPSQNEYKAHLARRVQNQVARQPSTGSTELPPGIRPPPSASSVLMETQTPQSGSSKEKGESDFFFVSPTTPSPDRMDVAPRSIGSSSRLSPGVVMNTIHSMSEKYVATTSGTTQIGSMNTEDGEAAIHSDTDNKHPESSGIDPSASTQPIHNILRPSVSMGLSTGTSITSGAANAVLNVHPVLTGNNAGPHVVTQPSISRPLMSTGVGSGAGSGTAYLDDGDGGYGSMFGPRSSRHAATSDHEPLRRALAAAEAVKSSMSGSISGLIDVGKTTTITSDDDAFREFFRKALDLEAEKQVLTKYVDSAKRGGLDDKNAKKVASGLLAKQKTDLFLKSSASSSTAIKMNSKIVCPMRDSIRSPISNRTVFAYRMNGSVYVKLDDIQKMRNCFSNKEKLSDFAKTAAQVNGIVEFLVLLDLDLLDNITKGAIKDCKENAKRTKILLFGLRDAVMAELSGGSVRSDINVPEPPPFPPA